MMLCLLSESFFASNELFLELDVAEQSNVNVIFVLEPAIRASDDFVNFEGAIYRWERRFDGIAIELAETDAEMKIVSRICTLLGTERPIGWSPGKLAEHLSMADGIKEARSSSLPIPDLERLTSCKITRDDAVKFLQILQKHVDNQARSVGVDPERVPSFANVPELQLILVFQATPIEAWPGIVLQCSPLINDAFDYWVAHLLEGAKGRDLEKLMQMLTMR